MGADYPGQEKAIEELRKMSEAAREFLAHHMRNSLQSAGGNIALAKVRTHDERICRFMKTAQTCLDHMLDDLKKIGC